MSRPPTATVFVGNLPFDATEGEVQSLLSQIGQIKNFRLMMDRETGKPRGFAFCEFYSKDDAESAHRNLSNTMFKGRQLRIDYAEENMSDRGYKPRGERDGGRPEPMAPAPRGHHPPPVGIAAAQQSAAQVSSLLGGPPSSDRHIQDMLNDLLASRSRAELWEVMKMLKDFLGGDKLTAKAFFAERPALSKAVFQAQVLLGMVKPLAPGFVPPPGVPEGPVSAGGRIGGAPPPPPRAAAGGPLSLQGLPPGAVPAPQGQMAQVVIVDPVTGQPRTVMVPTDQLGALGSVQPAQPGLVQPVGPLPVPGQPEGIILQQQPTALQAMPIAAAAPPAIPQPAAVQQLPPQQPPPQQQQQLPAVVQQPAPAAAAPGGGMLVGQTPQETQSLLQQVMAMSDETINKLPEQFKQQVLYIKEQIRLGHARVQ